MAADDRLCCLFFSLKPLTGCHGAAAIPYCDTIRQQALDGQMVEGQQQAVLPVDSQEV